MRPPGDEFGDWEGRDIVHELFDDEVVCDAEVGSGESPLGESEINSVHAEGDLVLQLARVGLLQAGTVADDERALAFVNVLQCREAANALPPPRVKKRRGQLRQTPQSIIRVASELPEWWRDDLFESLFHKKEERGKRKEERCRVFIHPSSFSLHPYQSYSVLNLAVAPPSTTNA